MDQLVTGLSNNREVRIYFATATDAIETLRRTHDTSPMSTMILGRLAIGAVLMGMMSKIDEEKFTLQVKGSADMGLAIAVADTQGNVKVTSRYTKLPTRYRDDHMLDVGATVGTEGTLYVIRDVGVGEPFVGQVALVSGEIAEDLTHYFAQSEQIATAVGLGVLLSRTDARVKAAGGFIVQLLPGASEETIAYLESQLEKFGSVTERMKMGQDIERIAASLMGDLGLMEMEPRPIQYRCDCSREKILVGLSRLGEAELTDILETDGSAEIVCHFCNTTYEISGDELRTLIAGLEKQS